MKECNAKVLRLLLEHQCEHVRFMRASKKKPPYKSIGGGLQCSAHEAAVLFGKLAARGRGALLSRLWNYEQRWSEHLVLNIIPTYLRPWSSEPAFSSHSSFPRQAREVSFGYVQEYRLSGFFFFFLHYFSVGKIVKLFCERIALKTR